MKYLFFFSVLSLSIFTGCLQTSATPAGTGGTGSSALGFAGASSAANLDGTRIKISWIPATNANVSGYSVSESVGSTIIYLATVSKAYSNYTHAGLTPGSLHSYVVRALDGTNSVTDNNLIIVTAFTYAGLTTAAATGTTTANVTFPAGGLNVSQINIYGTARGIRTLLSSASNLATSASLTGLNSGTTYSLSVVSLSLAGFEDQNPVTATLQTTSLSSTKYNGVVSVQAYGPAPNAPTGTPTAKQATITWAGFTGSTTSTQYALVRTGKGNPLDMTVVTACTVAATSSCLVCTKTGAGAQGCTDSNVAASPQQYDYAVTMMPSGWVEELPTGGDAPYRVTIAIPPNNMTLVQQDAGNYEMCQIMGKVSDPLNHQRCAYTGLGATPYNTNPGNAALGLSPNFYDFGYNLFVDRWTVGCNWTNQASGGMCGAGATAGDCNGNGVPAGTVGVVGNVYYDWNNAICYYRQAGSWQNTGSSGLLTPTQLAASSTIDPGSNSGITPPLVNITQNQSWAVCQAAVDSNYGAKRLLRHREFLVAAGVPWLTSDPGNMSEANIATLQTGNGHTAGTYSCNSDVHAGIAPAVFGTNELTRGIAVGPDSFKIGSVGTSQCVSRFGMQDFAGNVWQWLSDVLDTCSTVSHTCARAAGAALDSGNQDMNNFNFNGVQGPGSTSAGQAGPNYTSEWNIATPTFGASNFSAPLGLPLVGTDGGNASTVASVSTHLHSEHIWIYTDGATGVPFARGLFVGGNWQLSTNSGRWASYWNFIPTIAGSVIGFRCAVPAQ